MTSDLKERENFLRNGILIVDCSKDAFVHLIDLECSHKSNTFESFINVNLHEIYHLCYSSRCCQCPPCFTPPKRRVLYPSQLDVLLDESSKLGHHVNVRSPVHCCSTAKSGLSSTVLDLTLAKCLLIDFCTDVFWYSCLQFQSRTLDQFLTTYKHELYHLWQWNVPCCQCPAAFAPSVGQMIIYTREWNQMFTAVSLPCKNHRKRGHPGYTNCVCTMTAKSGITLTQLDFALQTKLLKNCCSLRKHVEALVQIRNNDYGHAKEGKMTDAEYGASSAQLESGINEIAKICKQEPLFKSKIHEAKTGVLDLSLCMQYQNSLLDFISKQNEMNENIAKIVPTIGDKIATKAARMADAESIQSLMNEAVLEMKANCLHSSKEAYLNEQEVWMRRKLTRLEKEKSFVILGTFAKCVAILDKYNVFMITGDRGSGKTRNGEELVRLLEERSTNFSVLRITDLKEVHKIIVLNRKIILLLDDAFNEINFSDFDDNTKEILETLFTLTEDGLAKVVITAQVYVRPKLRCLLAAFKLFDNMYEMKLNQEGSEMSHEEKEKILLSYCNINKIGIVDSTQEENLNDEKIIDKDFMPKLSKYSLNCIIKSDPCLGYPWSCWMFTNNKFCLRLGAWFFMHPSEFLLEEINVLRDGNQKESLMYTILIYMFLENSTLVPDSLVVEQFSNVQRLCYPSFTRPIQIYQILKYAAEMNGRYLKHVNESDSYQFRHRMIVESIALSFFQVCPKLAIANLDFRFIKEVVRLEGYQKKEIEATLVIPSKLYMLFIERLVEIFGDHFAKNGFQFVEELCEARFIADISQEFANLLISNLSKLKTDDTLEIEYENKSHSVPFYFPAHCLFYVVKHKRDLKVFEMLSNELKKHMLLDHVGQEKVDISKHMLLASFSLLSRHRNEKQMTDCRVRVIWETIEAIGLTCDIMFYTKLAFKNSNYSTGNWLVSNLSGHMDFLDLITGVDVSSLREIVKTLVGKTVKFDVVGDDRTAVIKHIVGQLMKKQTLDISKMILTAARQKMVEILKWLLENSNKFQTWTCTELIVKEICENGWDTLLLIVLNKGLFLKDHMRLIVQTAWENKWKTILDWLIRNEDVLSYLELEFTKSYEESTLYENRSIMSEIMLHNITIWLCEKKVKILSNGNFDTQNANLQLLKWLTENIPYVRDNIFDMIYDPVNNTTNCGQEMIYFLVTSQIRSPSEIQSLLEKSVKECHAEIVKCLFQVYGHNHIDIYKVLCIALEFNSEVIIKLIISEWQVNNSILDIKTAMDMACTFGRANAVGLFLENVNHKCFDIDEIMNDVFWSGNFEILTIFLEKINHSLLNCQEILDTACKGGRLDIVKLLLEKIDQRLFNLNVCLSEAFITKELDIVRVLLPKIDLESVADQKIMNEDCFHGAVDVVSLLIEMFDHVLFSITHESTDIAGLLLDKVEHKVFDMKTAMHKACEYDRMDIVKLLLDKVDRTLFDMKTAMTEACEYGRLDIIKLLLDKVDHTLFDMKTSITEACEDGRLDIIKLLLDKADHTLFDMKTAMNVAFKCGNMDIVKLLLQNVDYRLFDMETAINEACKCELGGLDIVKLLLDKVDHKLFDMKTVMNAACENGMMDVVKLLLDKVDYTLFDMKTAMNEACKCMWRDVKLLLDKVDHKLFDMKTVMIAACENGMMDVVKLLLDKVDHKLFDMKTVMNAACEYDMMDVVKSLLDKVDHTLFDMKTAMNEACKCMWRDVDIVKLLIEKVDHTFFDMKTVMDEAFKYGRMDIVKLLLDKVDYTLFDIKTVMNAACKWGSMDIVKLLLGRFDHALFDMKTAMNAARECNWGGEDMVKLVLDKIDPIMFDVNTVMNAACQYGSMDIVKLLLNRYDHAMFDMKTVMNAACQYGSMDIVKLLLDKVDHTLFNMKAAMNAACEYECGGKNMVTLFHLNMLNTVMKEACEYGRMNIIMLFLDRFDHAMFDMNTLMNAACEYGRMDIVKLLLDNVDHTQFDMKAAMNETFESGRMDIVTLLLDKVDYTLFDMKTAMNAACENGMMDVVKLLLERFDHTLFDIKTAMNTACKRGSVDIVEFLLERFDHAMFDMKTVMNEACACMWRGVDIVKLLIDNVDHTQFDMKAAMNETFESGRMDIVTLLLDKVDYTLFDMKTAMNAACENGMMDVVKLLLERFDHTLFDMKTAMNTACKRGSVDIVEFLLERFDHAMFDMKTVMNEACACMWRGVDIVKLLIDNCDHTLFDMKTAMNEACESGSGNIVKLLLDKVDHTVFDMNTVMTTACESNNTYVVNLLLQRVDYFPILLKKHILLEGVCCVGNVHLLHKIVNDPAEKLSSFDNAIRYAFNSKSTEIIKLITNMYAEHIDLGNVMYKAVPSHDLANLVLWLLENYNYGSHDLQMIMNESCLHGSLEIVEWLWTNTEPKRYDMQSAMIKACRRDTNIDVVEWIWENVQHENLDVQKAMNNACRYSSLKIVAWIYTNSKKELLNMNESFCHACQHGNSDCVKWLIANVTDDLDIQNEIVRACRNENEGFAIVNTILKSKRELSNKYMVMSEACKHGRCEIIDIILKQSDLANEDMKAILQLILAIKITTENNEEFKFKEEKKTRLILGILKQVDPCAVDMTEVCDQVCSNGWIDILEWVWKNVDHSLFNITNGVGIACTNGRRDILTWAFQNLDISHIDVNRTMSEACTYGWLPEVKWLWENVSHNVLDMRSSVKEACTFGRVKIVEWVYANVNKCLFDTCTVLEAGCRNGWFDLVDQVLQTFVDASCNLTKATTEACVNGHLQIVKLIFKKFGENVFDLSELLECGYSTDKEVVRFLVKQFCNNHSFDMSVIVYKICGNGWRELLDWVLQNENSWIINWSNALINACTSGETEIVDLLLQNVDHRHFDFGTAMLFVCRHGWEEIASIFLDKICHKHLNLEKGMLEACRNCEQKIVQMLMEKADPSLFDVQIALRDASSSCMNEDLVVSILEKTLLSKFTSENLQLLRSKAREYSWDKVLDMINAKC